MNWIKTHLLLSRKSVHMRMNTRRTTVLRSNEKKIILQGLRECKYGNFDVL